MSGPNLSIGDRLQAEPYQVRRRVLELLDEMSAPMEVRSIEKALRQSGLSRGQARKVIRALKPVTIIAIGNK